MTQPWTSSRFLRKVGFALPPGEQPPANPLQWALDQLDTPPPIAHFVQGGKRQEGLPEQARLLTRPGEVMTAYRENWNAVDAFFSLDPATPQEEKDRIKRQTIFWRFRDVEHWKETQARVSTALHGERPVFERLWHFWTNHFMVAPNTDNNDTLVGPYQRSLRAAMNGSFRDMLWAAVTHPGMLAYLDNYRNTGPNSPAKLRGLTKQSINENLGRELLELFTVTPAAGYTQADVEQATLILTGWTFLMPNSNQAKPLFPSQNAPAAAWGTFFAYGLHEPGEQSVLGKRYSASIFRPRAKLDALVTDLAEHPATIRHIAHKLCCHFIADEPPAAAVAAVEKAFRDSQGQMRAIHTALVRAVWEHGEQSRKFLNPETWLVQAHQMLRCELPQGMPAMTGPSAPNVLDLLRDLGQALPYCPQPNGWPILSRDWISRELLDRRVRTAQWLAERSPLCQPGGGPDLQALAQRELSADSRSLPMVKDAIAAGDLGRAAVVLLSSPEVLWA